MENKLKNFVHERTVICTYFSFHKFSLNQKKNRNQTRIHITVTKVGAENEPKMDDCV